MRTLLPVLLSSYATFQSVTSDETSIIEDEITAELAINGIASACNNLEDGEQWIRPFDGTMSNGEEYPNIKVKCSDGWTILDYDLDSYISNYFTSFTSWTEYAASSKLDDRVTWRQWFLPSAEDSNIKFRLSEDCSTCLDTEEFGDNSAYYMTGNYIGCLWVAKGYCDMDPESLQCYECQVRSYDATYSGLCTHMEYSADEEVYTEHDLCTTNSFNVVPSLGTNGQYCVCYKPDDVQTNDAGSSFSRGSTISSENEEEPRSIYTKIEVYNDDFKHGTYRITEPGTYILQEDIIFNMNAPDDYDSPNGEGAWYPRETDADMYEGADGGFVGAYSMGFFTGFAIESSDVTIDLNGFTIKMSKEFHLQQRWFSHIEIGSKAFISGQGPGNFGAFLSEASNVIIQNGVLGLSSHHGIHGNGASQVVIQDLKIEDFEVAGIALNGFDGVTIERVVIGSVYQQVPVLGLYTQARLMLPRMRKVIEETDETVMFDYLGEEKSMLQLTEELENEMDAVFHYVMNGVEYDTDDEVWSRAKSTFINDWGLPSASTVYGIFLNSLGASVFAIGGAPGHSYNAVIRDVQIRGLINDPWEVPRIMSTKGPFNDIVDVTRLSNNGMTVLNEASYIGNSYSDAQFALAQLSTSWSVLSHSAWTDQVVNWITNGDSLTKPGVSMKCNNDIMLHVTKGIFGLRLDSIDGFIVENVDIQDLQNIGYYGSTVCGNYETEDDGGHRNQKAPMQTGYTGTEIHGMTIVNSKGSIDKLQIGNIVSARGDATGLQIFPGNELELGQISIKDVHAGAYSKSDDVLLYKSRPNKVPRGCALDVWTYYLEDDEDLQQNVLTFTEDSSITGSCVTGNSCDWEYSKELVNDITQCLVREGNLVDHDQIVEGLTYWAIESNNQGIYSGINEKLLHQDNTRDLGDISVTIKQMEEDNLTPVELESSSSNGNGETEPDVNINTSKSNSKHTNKTVWVYVLIACVVIVTCMVGIVRRCLRSRRLAARTRNNNSNFTYDAVTKTNTNKNTPDMVNVGKGINNYASIDSAEYTPLIHTGPAV